MKRKRKQLVLIILMIVTSGLLWPQKFIMPVSEATKADYNQSSYWYYPWGRSGTHKGVDIFANQGTTVMSSTAGFVVYKGNLGRGGKVVLVLGPKWRIHYYAHLNEIKTTYLSYLYAGKRIGTVGKTGNATNTPPHLHYSIITLLPYPWRVDKDIQGWKKMFYLNPIEYLNQSL